MQQKIKIFLFGIIFLSCSTISFGQSDAIDHEGNLPTFYKRTLHFGFHIGLNTCDFRIHNVKTSQFPYDTLYWLNGGKNYSNPGVYDTYTLLPLKTIYSIPDFGFNLGIVSDLRVHEYVRLRFLPTLSFASRKLVYTYEEKYTMGGVTVDTVHVRTRPVESVFLFFPLLVKLQSKRMGDVSAYVLGGGSYSIDLQSDKKVDPTSQLVRVKRSDFYAEGGGGLDFYLRYFKLGLELKVMHGLKDIIFHDGSKYAAPIKRLNSHMVMFSVTFEG